jgi:hypothetical protein
MSTLGEITLASGSTRVQQLDVRPHWCEACREAHVWCDACGSLGCRHVLAAVAAAVRPMPRQTIGSHADGRPSARVTAPHS